MRLTLSFLLLFASSLAWSQTPTTPTTTTPTTSTTATTIVSYSGSYYRVDQPTSGTTNTPLTIYAGATDTGYNTTACSGNDNVNQCNSCASAVTTWGTVCNTQEIYPNLTFAITVSSTNTADYGVSCNGAIVLTDGNQVLSSSTSTGFSTGAASVPVTGNFTWANICSMFGTAGCTASMNLNLTVGFGQNCQAVAPTDGANIGIVFRYVDSTFNGSSGAYQTFGCGSGLQPFEGFCNFTLFPGDQKLYVQNATINAQNSYQVGSTGGASPTADESTEHFRALRMFYGADSSGTGASVASLITPQAPFSDLQADGNGNLTSQEMTGLQDDVIYVAGTANVDDSGNLTYYSNISQTIPTGNKMNFMVGSVSNAANYLGTTQSAKPEVVYGLLDGQKCFIATAAFGSEMAPQLDILRAFRSKILVHLPGGRSFIYWYYRNSPIYAAWLNDHPALKPFVRALLWPIILVSDILLNWSIVLVIALAAGILTILSVAVYRVSRRRV